MNLNNGDIKNLVSQCTCTSAGQNSPITPSMHCSMNTFITIVEIHMLIIDVCVYLADTLFETFL